MSKATPIDRIAYTKARFAGKLGGNPEATPDATPQIHGAGTFGLPKCPMCGELTLKDEVGCAICTRYCPARSAGMNTRN